jgi:hypothetical protein
VSKLYYLACPAAAWAAFEAAFRRLVSTVDGRERQATPRVGHNVSWIVAVVKGPRPREVARDSDEPVRVPPGARPDCYSR